VKAGSALTASSSPEGALCFGDPAANGRHDRCRNPPPTGRQLLDCNNFTPACRQALLRPAMAQALRLGTTMVLSKGACLSNQTFYFRPDRNIDKPSSRPGLTQAARQISSAVNTAQVPESAELNVACLSQHIDRPAHARSATWTASCQLVHRMPDRSFQWSCTQSMAMACSIIGNSRRRRRQSTAPIRGNADRGPRGLRCSDPVYSPMNRQG